VQEKGDHGGSETYLTDCFASSSTKADADRMALHLMPAVLEPTSKRLRESLLRCAVPIVYQILLVSFVGDSETHRETVFFLALSLCTLNFFTWPRSGLLSPPPERLCKKSS
jgi:hypothetical protein